MLALDLLGLLQAGNRRLQMRVHEAELRPVGHHVHSQPPARHRHLPENRIAETEDRPVAVRLRVEEVELRLRQIEPRQNHVPVREAQIDAGRGHRRFGIQLGLHGDDAVVQVGLSQLGQDLVQLIV